jgi:hypothetical protein
MTSIHRRGSQPRVQQGLPVEAGQVVCPRRGVVDLELCFSCPHFGGFQEGITEDLVCNYESVPGIPGFTWGVEVGSRSGAFRWQRPGWPEPHEAADS